MNETVNDTTKNETTETQTENTQNQATKVKHRLLTMVVLAVSTWVALSVLIVLIIGQTLFGLFSKEPNDSMRQLAKRITDYTYSALNYLSFNSDVKPFPYQGWDDKNEDGVARTTNTEASV